MMNVGERLRLLRESKNLSQGDIEQKTGLLRCYISRVENGHTVPSIDTLEKLARAMNMELYQLLYDGNKPAVLPDGHHFEGWGSTGKNRRYLSKLCGCLSRMESRDKILLMDFAESVIRRKKAS